MVRRRSTMRLCPWRPPYTEAVAGDAPIGWAPAPALGDPGTRDLPWYGIGPIDAVARAYLKAFRFDGRASRGEYWWFSLYGFVMIFAAGFLGSAAQVVGVPLVITLVVLVGLAHIPVGLSLTVRRLHDTGSSGWMYLLCLVPYLGALVILIMCCVGPNPTGVRFDPPSVRPLDHGWGYPYG
ncbi:DUF805 domain-containing protein [Pseudactinotalea sp.]|uniref:DUF805 domain-containing protein n=1 Tax=Pseudactinotalea sp. TaxID=1926260 RepID=UPI003B3A857F